MATFFRAFTRQWMWPTRSHDLFESTWHAISGLRRKQNNFCCSNRKNITTIVNEKPNQMHFQFLFKKILISSFESGDTNTASVHEPLVQVVTLPSSSDSFNRPPMTTDTPTGFCSVAQKKKRTEWRRGRSITQHGSYLSNVSHADLQVLTVFRWTLG